MRKLLTILFLFLFTLAGATNYYVKTGGNDAAAGTSDGTAWAHHPWMNTWTGSVTLAAGDVVYMNRGNTWTHATSGNYMTVGQSGTAGNYIKTTAYGIGAQPRIYHSYVSTSEYSVIYANAKSYLIFDDLNIEHSTSTYGAGMGIYLSGITNPCHDIIITNCEIENIPHSAVYGAFQCYNIAVGDTTAITTATTSSYSNNIHHFGYSGVGLMGCKQSTLVSNNKIYYNYIHHSTRTTAGNNAYGVFFSVALSTNGEPHYCYARYNNIQYILTWEGMDCHSGTYLYFQYNYINNCGFQGIAISTATKGTRELHHIYVDGNTIEYNSGWVTGRELGAIVFWNTDYPSASNNIYIRDNTIFYTSRPASSLFNAITVNCVNGITISGNTIYNGPTVTSGKEAIYIYGSYVSNVIIENNFIKQWGIPIKFSGTGLTGSIKIRENIITKPVGQCIGFNNALPASVNMEVYNNVFLNDTYGYVFYNPYGGGTITAKNNILGRASSGSLYYWYLGSGTYNIDYNMYWNSSTASPFYTGGGARTFAVWQSTYGYDTHGYNATNPLFLNAGGSYLLDTDFQIPTGSPAKDKGIGVGISLDYFGNTISSSPDIGVHEFAGTPEPDEYPTVVTGGTTYIPYTSASSGGNVTDEGTAAVTARGVCWATTINPTVSDSHTHDGTGAGLYTSSITGLDGDETYYVRAYATSTVGTAYGSQVSFTTLDPPVLPTVVTIPVYNISMSNAIGGGTITDDGNADITARGVCWALTANPTTAVSHTTDGVGSGGFTSTITDLTSGTLYHVRAYATNSVGTTYGSDVTFTTMLSETFKVMVHNGKVVYKNGKIQTSSGYITPPVEESTLTTGLISIWELDESGGNAMDSYDSNHGLVTGTTRGVDGKIGTAYTFNGTSDGILIPTIISGTSFSISLWVYPNTPVAEGSLFEATAGQGLALLGSDVGADNLKLMWYQTHQHILSPALTNLTWNHVVVSVSAGTGTVYVNGDSIGDIDHAITSIDFAEIGVRLTHEYFKGTLDAIRYWNRALTGAEVTELYTNENAGTTYPW